MIDIVENVSKLTTIPKQSLDKLNEKVVWCICDGFEQDVLDNKKYSELDLGIGILYISNTEDDIKYKFKPSELLENNIRATAVEGKNPLVVNLEKRLADKIVNTYKDII